MQGPVSLANYTSDDISTDWQFSPDCIYKSIEASAWIFDDFENIVANKSKTFRNFSFYTFSDETPTRIRGAFWGDK
jgi:hypothetical protein